MATAIKLIFCACVVMVYNGRLSIDTLDVSPLEEAQ